MRIVFTFIMFIHAIIHLLGFVKGWNIVPVKQFSGKMLLPITGITSRILGTAWLLTFFIFIISAIGLLLKKDWWWMASVAAVVISQILITLYWHDAKAGSIATMLIVVVSIFAYADWNFSNKVDKEVNALFTGYTRQQQPLITNEMLAGLPGPVQKWLERSSVVGKEKIETVRLKQKGEMRTKPDGNWMPAEAEQYFTIDKPAFIWNASIQLIKDLPIRGRDKYEDGRGNMLIRFLSLLPIANASGKEIDQGTLHRYLSEMVWFPTAALSDYIAWKEINDRSAQATITYGGITATGIFTFDEHGDMISYEAQRYREVNGQYSLDTWFISNATKSYKEFNGIRIPDKAEATWKLKEGDFTYYRVQITEIEYNNPAPY